MPIHNKLVRDEIINIIQSSGKTCRSRILDEAEYEKQLNTKLKEELEEYLKSGNSEEALEELADVLEVIRALAKVHGADWDKLESIRVKKAEARGGFEKRVFLIDVDDA